MQHKLCGECRDYHCRTYRERPA